MNRILLLLIAALSLFASTSSAQSEKASAKLYTQVDGTELRFAVVIDIDPGFHLYHHELGAPDSIGMPLTVKLDGEVDEFSELTWPEPHRFDQLGLGDDGRDTFILGHSDELVLFGRGTLEEGVTEPELEAVLAGLTCEDSGACFPYNETIESSGAGAASLWAKYPAADLAEVETPAAKGADPEIDLSGFSSWTGPKTDDSAKAAATLYTRTSGTLLQIAIEIEISDEFHLYHQELGAPDSIGLPTDIELFGDDVTFKQLVWPEPHKYTQEGLGADGGDTFILGHSGKIVIYGQAELASGATSPEIRADLRGQTCMDDGVCLQYSESISSSGEGQAATWSDYPKGDWPTDEEEDEGLLGFLLAAIGGGIFALLMPCTYPMIPITISFFTKQAEARGGNVVGLSLIYGLGIIAIFTVIGAVGGKTIASFASHPITNLVLGTMFLVFAATLFGAITLNPPKFLMGMAGKASMKGGLIGVFMMGMTLVLTSFTCTAPFVGSLLSFSGGGGPMKAALGMAVFGTTMAVPFTFLAMVPGRVQSLPSSGEWMNTLKVSLGFIELAAALKFISNADILLQWNFLSRELFLILWAVIFLIGGIYLMGWIRVKGYAVDAIGAGRMLGAMSFLLFATYCWHGYQGHRLDSIMTAIIPNYSSSYGGSEGNASSGASAVSSGNYTIIKDDLDKAKEVALAEAKPVLINFTGYI
ncbi:MAG: DsbC/DsbD-like thiol-disulfide interchange protein/cytochrome c biogenesis protein CcdA [Planctomycetota bacterium]|jgi:DsbC/DsbD-like thiol-disulfide interchange protein/cytochrome c biogenesis protein CcdA